MTQASKMPTEWELALELHDSILGEARRAMPCGCVMRIANMLQVDVRPYKPYRELSYPSTCCAQHDQVNCPYIHQVLNE